MAGKFWGKQYKFRKYKLKFREIGQIVEIKLANSLNQKFR